jgi:hypothetical protein
LELNDGACRFYADFGSIKNSTSFFEVVPHGERAESDALVIEGNELTGRLEHLPLRLVLTEDHVDGVYGTASVRFAIDSSAEFLTLRSVEPDRVRLEIGLEHLEFSAPGVWVEAIVQGPGHLAGDVQLADDRGKATVRMGNCDLGFLREHPHVAVMVMVMLYRAGVTRSPVLVAEGLPPDKRVKCGNRYLPAGSQCRRSRPDDNVPPQRRDALMARPERTGKSKAPPARGTTKKSGPPKHTK